MDLGENKGVLKGQDQFDHKSDKKFEGKLEGVNNYQKEKYRRGGRRRRGD